MTRYTAHFDPQASVNGRIIDIDADGQQTWDCTAYAEQHRDYLAWLTSTSMWMLGATLHDGLLDTDDVFKDDPAAPQWVRDYNGPFTICLYPSEESE